MVTIAYRTRAPGGGSRSSAVAWSPDCRQSIQRIPMNIIRFATITALSGAVLAIAGCATPQHKEPVTIERPADAFNAVGSPYKSSGNNNAGSLSQDVERLQDARRLYEQSRNTRRRSHRTN